MKIRIVHSGRLVISLLFLLVQLIAGNALLAQTTILFSDDFNTGALDGSKWRSGTNSGNQAAVVNNALELRSQGSQSGWILTRNKYKAKNTTVSVKAMQPGDDGDIGMSPNYNMSNKRGIYGQKNWYRFYTYRPTHTGPYRLYVLWKKNNVLGGNLDVTGNLVITGTVYLRLRFDNTRIYFDASFDGVNWSNAYSEVFGLPGYTLNTSFYYELAAYNTATNGVMTADDFEIRTLDTQAPAISNVAAGNLTASTAMITWATNEVADSQVEYGLTTNYGSTSTLNPALVTSHAVLLTGLQSNTLYHYRVKSKDAAGNLATSGDFTFTTLSSDVTPPVISNVAAGNITISAATISWMTDEAADSQVEYGLTTSYGVSTPLDPTLSTAHAVSLSNLQSNTLYHYRVKSKDAAGNLATSGDFTFTTLSSDVTPPVISNVAAGNITIFAATISWMTDEAADSQVEYGLTTSYGVSTPLDPTLSTAHAVSLSNLQSNTLYHYRVKSKDAAGNLATSGDFTFTTLSSDVTPPVISNVAAGNITISSATISWATDEAADSQVEYGLTTSYGVSTPLDPTLSTSHAVSLPNLQSNTLYHYRVKSKDAAGNLATSGDFTFTTLSSDVTPPVISNVAAGNIAISSATISWMTNEAADSQVEYGLTTSYGSVTPLDPALLTSHAVSLSNLQSNTLYHYRVKSKDAAGNLATSGDFTFTTLSSDVTPPVISNVAAENIAISSATISWATDEAADSQVEYGLTTSYGVSTPLDPTLSTVHAVSLSNLQSSTLYHYRVKSKDAAGNLATSGDFTFTTLSSDVTPPVISNVAAGNITISSATISWMTDEAADSQVEYGLTTSYGVSTPLDPTLSTAHAMSLSNLQSSTLYHYRVKSKDAAGNLATSGDFTFTTLSSDVTPPVISNVAAGNITISAATISWTTNEAADSQVEYGLTTNYGVSTPLDPTLSTAHAVSLSNLQSSTLYHYRVKSKDAAGNLATSDDFTFTTSGTTTLFTDDFNAGTLDLNKWNKGTNAGNQSAVVNNQLRLQSPDFASGWVITRNAYQAKNTTIGFKVVQPNNDGAVGITPTYTLSSPYGIFNENNWYRFYVYRSSGSGPYRLFVQWKKNGAENGLDVTGSLVINGVVYLRLRCDDTHIHFEASLNGVNWTDTYSEAFGLPGYTLDSAFYYELAAYNTPSNGVLIVDDFSIISTSSMPDTQPPVISAVVAQNVTTSSATITWNTNEASDSQVEYGLTTNYGSVTTLNPALVTSHAVALSGLQANKTYHFRVKSRDAAGNLATSGDFTFNTASTSVQFVDITASAGVAGIPEYGGHAIIFADVNDDNRMDMYVTHTNFAPSESSRPFFDFDPRNPEAVFLVLPDELFMNNGNNTFTENAAAAGVDDPGESHGAVFVDIDNDGDFDLFNGQRGPHGNRLYRNNGNGTFTEVTAPAGILPADRRTIGVLALDIENDGDMDLFSANWGVGNEMYVNDGTGHFTVEERGVTDVDPDPNGTMAATAADVDNDGDMDIFMAKRIDVAGDASKLYINNGSGFFTNQAAARGVAYTGHANGAVFVDLDWDGDLDMLLAVTGIDRSNPIIKLGVYRNQGNGTFVDETNLHNIPYDGFTLNAGDLDNDGDVDIFTYINSGTGQVWLNNGTGQFAQQTNAGFSHVANDARAATLADIDNDGDLDVAFTEIKQPTSLYRNDLINGAAAQNYLQIELTGANGRVGLFGSKFYLFEAGHLDEPAYLRGYQQLTSTLGTLSQNFPIVHFGVSPTKTYDLRVRLLDGNSIVRTNITPGQRLHLQAAPDTQPPVISSVTASGLTSSAATITWTTNEAADSQVEYGLTASYGASTPLDPARVTSHTVALANLTPNTLYHYRVKSRDAAGNLTTSSDAVFTTLAINAVKLFTSLKIQLATTTPYSNPYLDLSVTGVFTSPTGRVLRLKGFWDGAQNWIVSFAPDETGVWNYQTQSADAALVKSGTFTAVANPEKRGFVRVSAARPYQFEYSDGTPCLLMGDTNWEAMSSGVGYEARFKPYIDLRASQNFNAYHTIVVHSRYDYQSNEGGAPFAMFDPDNRNYDSLNPNFFKWVDKRVAYADSMGVTSILFFSWAYEIAKMSTPQYDRIAQYIVARYAAYNVFWVLAGDYHSSTVTTATYRQIGQAVANADPYDHPLTIHPSNDFSNREFANEAWMSYVMHQMRDAGEFIADSIRTDRIYNKPVVNGEYGYHQPFTVFPNHGIRQDAKYTRTGGWSLFGAGGYFVAGFLHTFLDPDGHYPYDPDFDVLPTYWDLDDPLDLEAARQYSVFAQFFRNNTAWQNLAPHPEWVRDDQTELLATPGVEYVAYHSRGGRMRLQLPVGYFSLAWFDPIAGALQPARIFESTGETVLLTPSDTLDAAALLRPASAPALTNQGNVTNLQAEQLNIKQVRFTWQTPVAADSRIDLQKPNGVRIQFVDNRETTTHDLVIDGLAANVNYTVTISSQTADGREWKSAPQNLTTAVVVLDDWREAESMPTRTVGRAEPPGWNLNANGYIATTLNFPQTGFYTFTIRTRGECRQSLWPNLLLELDGNQLMNRAINTAIYKEFVYAGQVSAGSREAKISFTNDGNGRQLIVDWLHVQFNGNSDTQAPVISNVTASNISNSSATINWNTNEASDSQVEYGLTASYGASTPLSPTLVTSHSVNLSSLQANTTYHYRVKSRDAAGNLATSGDFTFATTSTPPPFDVTLEAENMPIKTTGAERPPGWALWDNGYIAQTVNFTSSGLHHFTLQAMGKLAEGEWPQAELRIDQASRAIITVSASSYMEFSAEFTVTAGPHEVAVAFINDLYNPPEDRNLYVDWLRIYANSSGPTDTQPPIISGVAANNVTTATATIVWITDEASDSQVEYGLTTGYGVSTPLDPAMFTSHAVSLSNLLANTIYHYRVKSRDAAGNLAASNDFTFTTNAAITGNVAFANVQDIFNNNCVRCHQGVGAPGGLVLLAGQAHGNIVNVTSTEYPQWQRVQPGNRASSWLYEKITNPMPPVGSKMGSLSADEIELIGKWIDQGATATPVPPYANLQFRTTALVNGEINIAYGLNVVVWGGLPPYQFSVVSGALPPGLELDLAAGMLAGVPTTVGSYYFTIRVSDSQSPPATLDRAYSLDIFNTQEHWQLPSGFVIENVVNDLHLPVSIAFVPNPGPNPTDPYFYVTLLYGDIVMVQRNFQKQTYATGLLNFTPIGDFPGSGEMGVTGIVVDPASGDVFASLVYDDGNDQKFDKVVRFHSIDGGHTAATQTMILSGIPAGVSHQIQALTIGPDGKLYVNVGDGWHAQSAPDLNDLRGKILRMNLDGSIPADNPFPNNYVYASGIRNPFGAAWRPADGKLYISDNGPEFDDRLVKVLPGQDYGWNLTSPDLTIGALYLWNPPVSPVEMDFGDMLPFPAEYRSRLFVGLAGVPYALGWQVLGKEIQQFDLDAAGNVVSTSKFLDYVGAGRSTIVGLAAAADGLYFTDLFGENGFDQFGQTHANVYRIRWGAADGTPPVITNVEATLVTGTSATIVWQTDEPASRQVEYGLTTNYGLITPLETNLLTNHSVMLSQLTPETTYHFHVISMDAANNPAISADFTFTTTEVDATPPVISNVQIDSIAVTNGLVKWTTNEPATSFVDFGATADYGTTASDTRFVTSHRVRLTGLADSTLYHFRVRSLDASGNTAASSDGTFTTRHHHITQIDTTLEAENMPIKTTGDARPPGWALLENGYVAGYVTFPVTGSYRFTLHARGREAFGVWPLAELRLNQATKATLEINSADYVDFAVDFTVAAGAYEVAIAFINDIYEPPLEDRNLYVDWLRIQNSSAGSNVIKSKTVALTATSPPETFALQNYPNPFNAATRIHFALPQAAEIELTVFDMTGHELSELAGGSRLAGNHEVIWTGRDRSGATLSSGVYLVRLRYRSGKNDAWSQLIKRVMMVK